MVTIYINDISLLIDMINWSIYRITFSYCSNHENVWIFCITNKTYIRPNITRYNRTGPLHIHLQIAHHKPWLWGWWRLSGQGPQDGSIPMIRSDILDLWKVRAGSRQSLLDYNGIVDIYIIYVLIKDFSTLAFTVPFLQNGRSIVSFTHAGSEKYFISIKCIFPP